MDDRTPWFTINESSSAIALFPKSRSPLHTHDHPSKKQIALNAGFAKRVIAVEVSGIAIAYSSDPSDRASDPYACSWHSDINQCRDPYAIALYEEEAAVAHLDGEKLVAFPV